MRLGAIAHLAQNLLRQSRPLKELDSSFARYDTSAFGIALFKQLAEKKKFIGRVIRLRECGG
jgi:hypothetical protein